MFFVPRVLVTSGSTTRRVHATTAVTTTEIISTQKAILRASADPITENMHDSSSAASILSDNTQKITCKNLSPSNRQDGVPISSEAYSISFRYELYCQYLNVESAYTGCFYTRSVFEV